MPLVGPNYFSLCSSTLSTWQSPEHAENAPDGNLVLSPSSGTPQTFLLCFNWQGVVPKGYYWDFPNFVIEAYYSNSNSGAGILTGNFQTRLMAYVNGDWWGTLSSIYSTAYAGTLAWGRISATDWGNVIGLPTDIPIGIGISFLNPNPSIFIDSVRMTVSYNNNDNFFSPPYGVVKKKRRFITKKGKVIAQTRVR